MKKIFMPVTSLIVSLIIVSMAAACTSPTVYNQYGVPINIYGGGMLTIWHSDYGPEDTIVDYTFDIKNNDDQPINITFTASPDLFNTVWGSTHTLEAGEQKGGSISVNIGGNSKRGDLYVTGLCEDGLPIPEGVVDLIVYGREDSVQECKGTPQDCGMPGECEDVTQYDGCYDGYNRDYYCASNTKQFTSSCTSYCCGLIGGTCKSGVCDVPSLSVDLAVDIINSTGQPVSATIKLYRPGTSVVLNSTDVEGSGVIFSPNATVDFGLEYDSSVLKLLIKDLNLIEFSDTLQITLDDVSASITDVDILKAYMVTSSLDSFTGYLKFAYSSLPFSNEDALAIYKCDSYNMTSESCDETWIKQSTSIVNDVASTEVTSFSAYALGEDLTVTTTVPTTTTPSNDGGGSSGGSSSSSGGSYSSKSSKITGFYGFPETVEVDTGSSETVYGEFYSNLWLTLKDVTFALEGVDSSWYVIDPAHFSIVTHGQTKNLAITFNIPEDAEAAVYPIEIEASSVTTQRTYTIDFDLIINPAPAPVEEPTTTTITETTTIEKQEGLGIPLGSFLSTLTNNWYFVLAIPAVAVAVIAWKFLPGKIKFPSGSMGQFASIKPHSGPTKTEKHVVLKPVPVKPKPQPEKIDKVVDNTEKERRVKAKRKVLEEMRKRAIDMDKKLK